jgi:hypothetical protein
VRRSRPSAPSRQPLPADEPDRVPLNRSVLARRARLRGCWPTGPRRTGSSAGSRADQDRAESPATQLS